MGLVLAQAQLDMGLPRAPLHGGSARAEGEEGDDGDVEFPEYFFGPTHLKVNDSTERLRLRLRLVSEMGVEVKSGLLCEWVGTGYGRAERRSGDMEDRSEGVLREGGRDGRRESGGNDEGSMVITGDKVITKLHGRVEVALPRTCNNKYHRRVRMIDYE